MICLTGAFVVDWLPKSSYLLSPVQHRDSMTVGQRFLLEFELRAFNLISVSWYEEVDLPEQDSLSIVGYEIFWQEMKDLWRSSIRPTTLTQNSWSRE
jgi:hypothetical protein